MKKLIKISKKEFEGIDLSKIKEIERVDVTEDGVEITFLIED